MGAGELARAPMASCFQTVVSNHQKARRDASPRHGRSGDVSPPRWRLSIRPRRSAALPCGAATGGTPVVPPNIFNGRDARCPSAAVSGRPPYRLASGWNADFLVPRIAAGSSFVKAKHLEPRSFSDAPMR